MTIAAAQSSLIQRLTVTKGAKIAPVERWNPPFCGDLDMHIKRDGIWYYHGSPIGRKSMVRLFASVLRRDDDQCYYMVTPVEKMRIRVDDVPFIATTVTVSSSGAQTQLDFETNVGDQLRAGSSHPLRFVINAETDEPMPYIRVRGRLDARISRPAFYELIAHAVEADYQATRYLGVWSDGVFFPIVAMATLSM